MSIPVSKTEANHYLWAKVCDGWRLANCPDLSVIEEKVPAGASEARHYHEKARQFFYILSGIATFELDGNEFQISANSGIEVAPGLRHKFMNKSSDDVCFLVISAPSTQGDRIDVENH
jgi:mannose-6-phosphate isomerase-like protein (cupin superfamily)